MSFRCQSYVVHEPRQDSSDEPTMSRQTLLQLSETVWNMTAEFIDLLPKAKHLRYIATFHATFVVENNQLVTNTITPTQINNFQVRLNSIGGLAFYDDVKTPTQILQLYIAGLVQCHSLIKQLFGITIETQMVSLAL